MSIVNDFEIVVHAIGVQSGNDDVHPCSVNVDSIFLTTDLRNEDTQELDEETRAKTPNTRLDLKQLFSTTGTITTAKAGGGQSYGTNSSSATSALKVRETIEELEELKNKGRAEHLKMLRESRLNIV